MNVSADCPCCGEGVNIPVPTEAVPDDQAGFSDTALGPMRVPIAKGDVRAQCWSCDSVMILRLPSGDVGAVDE